MICPSGLIRSPRLWAKATEQPPEILRAAARVSRAQAIDPHSWATLRKLAAFHNLIGRPELGSMLNSFADLAKRRNRVVRACAGDSTPHAPTSAPAIHHTYNPEDHMASEWTMAGRTYTCAIPKRKPGHDSKTTMIIFEHPYNPATLATTHSMYANRYMNGQTILFLRGEPGPSWPNASLLRPATPAPMEA